MSENSRKPSLIFSLFYRAVFTVAAIFVVLVVGLVIAELISWQRLQEKGRAEHLEKIRTELKNDVEQSLDYVNLIREQGKSQASDFLKEHVNEAHTIAQHLYNTYPEKVKDGSIEGFVREALRPIRFNDGRGYFFAFNTEGLEKLSPLVPELEGKNLINMQSRDGRFLVREMIDIAKKEGDGTIDYLWPKYGVDPKDHRYKVSYFKLFKPLNWVIGAGDYLEDMEKHTRQTVIKHFKTQRLKMGGYVFAATWDGTSLLGPFEGKNVYDIQDINGSYIVRDLISKAKKGGGFVKYYLKRPNTGKAAMKLSYVTAIPEWQWYVGAGVFVEDIEQEFLKIKEKRLKAMMNTILLSVLFLLLAFIAFFATNKGLVNKAHQDYERFLRFFSEAARNRSKIDTEKLTFSEFEDLAVAAQRMTQARFNAEEKMKKAATEALRASKAKDEFLAKMSHELRTPLNAIIGFSDMMVAKTFGTLGHNNYEDYAAGVLESGQHLLELINDILDLSRIEAGTYKMSEHGIDVEKLFSTIRMIAGEKARAYTHKVDLKTNCPEGLPSLWADERMVRQILLNLLSNAIKFTPSGGTVILSAEQKENKIILNVQDTGIGIPKEKQAHVFDAFYQIEDLSTRNYEGAGLGLALVQQFASMHQAEMRLESDEGKGALFSIVFPVERTVQNT